MHIANNLLFINAAHILWSFNIRKAKDAQGNVITPSATNYHDTGLIVYVLRSPSPEGIFRLIADRLIVSRFISRPHLWEVDIIPRGPEVLQIAKERFAKGI